MVVDPIEVMLAGAHPLVLYGHGPLRQRERSLLARVRQLLPELDPDEVRELEALARASGTARAEDAAAPIRMPDSSISRLGLFGRFDALASGEVAQAHRGVLYLRDLLAFSRSCIEGLCECLDLGVALLGPHQRHAAPARFTLLATMNPCPCGWFGHSERPCTDSTAERDSYRARVSGLFPERVDMFVPIDEALAPARGVSAAEVRASRERIELARARQRERLAGTAWMWNAEITLDAAGAGLLAMTRAAERMLVDVGRKRGASAGTLHRVRRVARTIWDLQAEREPGEAIGEELVGAAVFLRRML